MDTPPSLLPPAPLQARKQRRAVDQVAPLIQEARAQLDYLAEVELMLAQSEEEGRRGDMAALREVQVRRGCVSLVAWRGGGLAEWVGASHS